MAAERRLKVVLQYDDSAVQKGTKRTQASLGSMTGAFIKAQATLDILKKGFSLVTTPVRKAIDAIKTITTNVVNFGKKSIESAGEFEQFAIAFDVMLGSAEKRRALMREITGFAIKTPFDLPQLVQGSKRLLAFGIEMDDIIPTLDMLGNVAAGLGIPMERLILNFGQVKTIGHLTGRELRDFNVAGVPLIPMLAEIAGVSEDVIAEMTTAGEISFPMVVGAFEAMSGSGGRFEDLMVRQSRTLPGAIANIRDSIGIFGRELVGVTEEGEIRANSLFDTIRVAVVGVGDSFTNFRDKFSDIVDVVDNLWEGFIMGFKKHWEEVGRGVIGELFERLKSVGTKLQELVSSENARKFFEQLGSNIAEKAVEIFTKLVEMAESFVDYISSDAFQKDFTGFRKEFGGFVDDVGVIVGLAADFTKFFITLGKVAVKFSEITSYIPRVIGKSTMQALETIATTGIGGGGAGGTRGGARQFGGIATAGTPYLVGERGPELFIPRQSGRVEPNVTNTSAVNFYGNLSVRSRADIDEIASKVARVLGRQAELARWHE